MLRRISAPVDPEAQAQARDAENQRLLALLRASSEHLEAPDPVTDRPPTREDFSRSRAHRLAVLDAQGDALLDARDDGTFDAEVLEVAPANLDADQIAIELRGQLATR